LIVNVTARLPRILMPTRQILSEEVTPGDHRLSVAFFLSPRLDAELPELVLLLAATLTCF
jgi:hypothetical protein